MMSQRNKTAGEEGSTRSSSSSLKSWTACWNQRTLPEKLLFSVILVIFIGFIVAMIVLVEIYLRLEDRLLTANSKVAPIVTDDAPHPLMTANLTQLPDYCLTTECVEAASRILTALDPDADPCDDMAAFACGGWIQRQVQTPNAKDVVMVLENLQAKVDHQIKLVLEAPPHPADLKAYGKLRSYFATCMADGQDQARHASVKKVMAELGPLIPPSEWNATAQLKSPADLTDLLIRVLQVNGAPLFDVAVQVDDRNTSRYIISIGLPRQSGVMPNFYSSLPKDLLNVASKMEAAATSSSSIRQEEHLRMKRQFNHFADNPSDIREETPEALLETLSALPSTNTDVDLGLFIPDANFLSSIQQLSREQKASAAFRLMHDSGAFTAFTPEEFLTEEATIKQVMTSIDQLSPSDRDKKLSQQSVKILNYFTVQQLQQKFGFIDWVALLSQVMDVDIKPEEEVIIHYPEILQQIQTIVSISDKRILHNAILMLVVRDLVLELFKVPPGMDKWSFCLQAARGGFGEVMSGLYLQQFTPTQLESYKTKAEDMFSALKESVVEMIHNSDWPDHTTKRKALRKARNLRSHVVAPKMFFNATFLESMAAQVDIEGQDFVAATWQLYRIFRKDFFAIYTKPVDETTVIWQLLAYPMIANAFYLQHFNSMVLPLALLHDPLFSLETPRYLGLGTLGFIVAHEIMHGFDNSGVDFDDDGRRKPLLTPASQRIFDEKMNCVSEQYSSVFQTEFGHNGSSVVLKVDGQLTLNENVADLGAIRAIVSTLARLEAENGPAQSLPGLTRYTNEQVMLINAAQAYCALINPQAYALIIGMDEHAPPHDRVNGFMMNLPDYGRIFNCPAGSRVNPINKCSVW